MPKTREEEILIRVLRQRIGEEKPKETGEKVKVSRDEALTEAEYVFKRILLENRPRTIQEAGQIIQNAGKMIFAYFKSLDYDITPQEFLRHLMRNM